MGYIKKWLDNGRSVSLMQSALPAILAAVLAIRNEGFCWWQAVLAVIGVECVHLALNLADDYFDYKVDMAGDRDRVIRKGFRAMTVKYPYLTDGSENLKSLRNAIITFFVPAILCGAAIFVARTIQYGFLGPQGSWWIVAIAFACFFLGMFYSAPPLKLAYRGLGELVIGFIFGPLLMLGVYYSACGRLDWFIALLSLPVGMLVLNILFTHSFIDMPGDAESNKMTFARLLGSNKLCLAAAYIFNIFPFLCPVIAVCCGFMHPAYLASLIVLPRALWLCNSLTEFSKGKVDVPSTPPAFLGKMLKDWGKVRETGIDWFLMRWLCARNTLSGFCTVLVIVKIILLICIG